jgi:flagellar protein FliO/FliZ
VNTFLVFLRTLLALGVVLGLVWGLSRLSRRAQGGGRGGRARNRNLPGPELNVTVVTRRSLSRSSAIAVIRVGDRNLVVGTTPQNVTLLTELPPQEWDLADDEMGEVSVTNDTPWKATSRQSPQAWDAVISTLRERTTRH